MSNQIGQAGTLESNDIMVTVTPAGTGTGIAIELTSIVLEQYGPMIQATLTQVCKSLSLSDLKITAADKGALDCTIQARLKTALLRAGLIQEEAL